MVLGLPDSWSNWNLGMLGFEKRVKPDYPAKNLVDQRRERTTNSTHIMNDFPVIGDLVMRTGLWDRQGANIASRYKEMYGVELFLRLKPVSLDRECHILP